MISIRDGGETGPCSLYYQLMAKGDSQEDTMVEFTVVQGVIKSNDKSETNVFTVEKNGRCRSPEFKLDIDIAGISQLLLSKNATFRLIISVLRA